MPALLALELIEEVVPLATKEVAFDMLEEQSLTLMIERVLGEFAPELEATEACDAKEEEVSSSTPGKDDSEGKDANNENQTLILLINKSRLNTRNRHQLRSRKVCGERS